MLDIKSDQFTDTFRNYIAKMYKDDDHLEVVIPRFAHREGKPGQPATLSGKDEVFILYPYSVVNKQGHCLAEMFIDGKYVATLPVDYDGVISRTDKIGKDVLSSYIDTPEDYDKDSFKVVQSQRDNNIYGGFALLAFHDKRWDGFEIIDKDAQRRPFVVTMSHMVTTKETVRYPVMATSPTEAERLALDSSDFQVVYKQEVERNPDYVVETMESEEEWTALVSDIVDERGIDDNPSNGTPCKDNHQCSKYPSCPCGNSDNSEYVEEEVEESFDPSYLGGVDVNQPIPVIDFPDEEESVEVPPQEVFNGEVENAELFEFQVVVKNKWADGVDPIVHRGFLKKENAEAYLAVMKDKYNEHKYDVLLVNFDGDTKQVEMTFEDTPVEERDYIIFKIGDSGQVIKKRVVKATPAKSNEELASVRKSATLEEGQKIVLVQVTDDGMMHNTENGLRVVITQSDAEPGDTPEDLYMEVGLLPQKEEE